MDKNLESYLLKYNIKYNLYKHPAVHTVEESIRIKIKIPGMHCKTLFLKDENNNFYLVGMKASKRLSAKIIRRHFKIKKLNFASPEELKRLLAVNPGSVSIFNIILSPNPKNIILVIDMEVWDAEISGFHPNTNTETINLTHENLEKYYSSLKIKKEIITL